MAEFVYQMYKARKVVGEKVILDDVTVGVYPGAKIGVVGPNGMGKSTLLKVMAGLEDVSNGEARLTPGYTVGLLQQEPPLDEDKTVRENIEMAFSDVIAKVNRFNQIGEEMASPDADFDALMAEMGRLQDEIDAANGWDLDSQLSQAMDALREGRHVRLSSIGELRIGIDKETPSKRTALSRLEQLFNETGLPYKTESDIVRRLYSKWMLNCGVNQTVAVVKGTFADVQKPGAARDMMKAAMREVIAIANKNGVNLTEDDLNEYVAIIDTLMPDGMPSMRQDTLAKRPTEVDLFAGTVIEKAKAAGIEVPVNTALYEKIKAIEAAY